VILMVVGCLGAEGWCEGGSLEGVGSEGFVYRDDLLRIPVRLEYTQ
jgi:hypothetical protein